jgi:hypothetical protein
MRMTSHSSDPTTAALELALEHGVNIMVSWSLQRHEIPLAIEKLAARGWTVPPSCTPGDVVALSRLSGENVDAWMVAHYATRTMDAAEFIEEYVPRTRPLATQAASAVQRGEHALAIPSLLSMIEGGIAALTTSHSVGKLRDELKDYSSHFAKNPIFVLSDSLSRVFGEQLWKSAPFGGARPNLINRHWVLHGRDDPAAWTVVDAYKTLNALTTTAALLEPLARS